MGKQYNKLEKRLRRKQYLRRKNAKSKAAGKPRAKKAPAAPAV